MLIYQSKANLDTKILFGEIAHPLDPQNRKKLVKGHCDGNEISTFHLVYDLLVTEI